MIMMYMQTIIPKRSMNMLDEIIGCGLIKNASHLVDVVKNMGKKNTHDDVFY